MLCFYSHDVALTFVLRLVIVHIREAILVVVVMASVLIVQVATGVVAGEVVVPLVVPLLVGVFQCGAFGEVEDRGRGRLVVVVGGGRYERVGPRHAGGRDAAPLLEGHEALAVDALLVHPVTQLRSC